MNGFAQVSAGSSAWGRVVAPAVALVIAASSVALAVVSDKVSDSQERQLLAERSSELASVLTLSMESTRSILVEAANATLATDGSKRFQAVTALSTMGGSTTIVVASRTADNYRVVARAGKGAPQVGASVDPDLIPVIGRAPASKGLVSGVVEDGGAKHAVLAVAISGTDRVAYFDSVLSSAQQAPSQGDSPFRELNVAVYAGPVVDHDQLVLVSGDVPDPDGPTVSKQFKIGSDTWTLEISARSPLVGSLATLFPWLVLAAGLAAAVFLGALIHVLMRRRAYALKLVEERTHLLKDAQLAAERANNAKSEFLSRMSHELRTPLNAVLGFAQLLELNGLTPEQAENVTQISRGGSHLLDLINEILDISQIETGRMSMSPESVLVSDVVDAAISLVGPLAIEKSVNLISSTEREPARYVFADRQRLKQILLNLLSNGIKYNRHGGSVSVNCFEPSPGLLRIQVTDTGPGIPAEKQHLLFVPFERLGAEDTLVEGTGVGLALSRGLATEMGGRLEVESTFGRGSTFWVELPIVESPLDRLEREDDVETESRSGKQIVLHIEDNPANLALVERVLAQRPELALVPAMQGRRGLEIAVRDRPALILLDLGLPDMTGTEVLKELRADPRTAGIPVVVISADAMPRQMQHLLSAGAAAYLTKPINIRDLLAQVDAALERAIVEA